MSSNSRSEVAVVVPAYNEASVIGSVLQQLCRAGYRVIVVDDASTDGTHLVALRLTVTLLRHVVNLGQGAALQTGIAFALQCPGTRYVVTFDSDGQHSVSDIDRLLAPLRAGTHEVALGSRFLDQRAGSAIPAARQRLLKLGLWFTRATTRLAVTDTHNGLRAFTAEAASRLEISSNRMAHASEILSKIAALGLRFCEVPVTITYSEYSLGKGQRTLDAVNVLWDILVARLR